MNFPSGQAHLRQRTQAPRTEQNGHRQCRPSAGKHPFPFAEEQFDGRTFFHLTLRQAAEFLSKKDYTDNWTSEMNEQFCFWSFSKWKKTLSETGFRIVENPTQPESGSRSYLNPWIFENRYRKHAELLNENKTALNFPPSNMVLVAEKNMPS